MAPGDATRELLAQALDKISQLINPNRLVPRLAYARVARRKHPYAPNR